MGGLPKASWFKDGRFRQLFASQVCFTSGSRATDIWAVWRDDGRASAARWVEDRMTGGFCPSDVAERMFAFAEHWEQHHAPLHRRDDWMWVAAELRREHPDLAPALPQLELWVPDEPIERVMLPWLLEQARRIVSRSST